MQGVTNSLGDLAQRWCGYAVGLPRYYKRAILVGIDLTILGFVLWLGLSVRHGGLYSPVVAEQWPEVLLVAAAPVMTVAAFGWFGLYRQVTRFIGPGNVWRIISCVGLSVLLWAVLVFMAGQHGVPRTVILFYFVAASLAVVSTRQALGWILRSAGIRVRASPGDRRAVLIYGAGMAGVRLLEALRRGGDREAACFIDSSSNLWGQYVAGLKVHRPDKLVDVIQKFGVKEVLVALPEAQRLERRQLLKTLGSVPVTVRILPETGDLSAGHVAVSDLRPLDVVDLLGREPVPPNPHLMASSVRGKSILVTGAGGSVGSELARQLVRQGPSRLVLLESAEPALYEIEREIGEITARAGYPAPVEVASILGSVLDPTLVADVLRRYEVRTVYHAAAYKHVPIVETNPIVGIRNNTFGTLVLARAAEEQGIERMVLVSTDKAVRPTSVMGASKRLAELILQARAAETGRTVFTVVRFGNVLDSSGSVVRKFRRQIAAGGPVTVTHPQMTRYFMSLREAAELVIQAGAMANGGEVFVLDMGEPVKIDELARIMIKLGGHTVRSDENPDGDIEIVYTGLRPGEKIFEELLINPGTMATEHPRIWWLDEPFLPWARLEPELTALQTAMTSGYLAGTQAILDRLVEGYHVRGQGLAPGEAAAEAGMPKSRLLH